MELKSLISNNRQLSAYICKVRMLAHEGKAEDQEIIDAVYSTLILSFNNCPTNQDTSRRSYYTKHCYIPDVDENKEAVNHLMRKWKSVKRVNIEYWLRSAEVMIRDNKINLPGEVINAIIGELNTIVIPEYSDVLEIAESFMEEEAPVIKKNNKSFLNLSEFTRRIKQYLN
ncbi:MAG: hypothetical protein J7604_18705 [Sporocytophaga sp.]|uniref:hypothetical protein n=1 Tax=Sporocytophaga sp. TaxID=2231183 RepID=UPI001B111CE8|nr:hypothetical protein [Sporocytophaga sp.]MBO9702247.1 hypothetical protein [Sporocytophaga sp.]